jgi:hypothetical protein
MQIGRTLRLTLWDEASARLVGFRDICVSRPAMGQWKRQMPVSGLFNEV